MSTPCLPGLTLDLSDSIKCPHDGVHIKPKVEECLGAEGGLVLVGCLTILGVVARVSTRNGGSWGDKASKVRFGTYCFNKMNILQICDSL